jgi:hypothetical protein
MHSMVRARLFAVGVLVALVATGCLSAPPGLEGDGGTDDDASAIDAGIPGHSALVFQWTALQTTVNEHLTIKDIRLPLRDIRAIGDAAPGDDRTYIASLELRWHDGEGPTALSFPEAPPGLYSRFEFRVQSADSSGWELQGEVTLANHMTVKFDIHDKFMLPISLSLSGVSLDVGTVQTIEVQANVAAVLGAIDWDELDVENGKIEIDENNPEMLLIRPALSLAFSAHLTP